MRTSNKRLLLLNKKSIDMRLAIISVVFICLITICNDTSAQTAYSEKMWHDSFVNYLEYLKENKTDDAIKAMGTCAHFADKARMDNGIKVHIWYLYLSELMKYDPMSKDIYTYSEKICTNGSKLDCDPTSYGITLITAKALIISAKYARPELKPLKLVKAYLLLQDLYDNDVLPECEEDYKLFYDLSGLSVSDKERMEMMTSITEHQKVFSSDDWFNAASEIFSNHDYDHDKQIFSICLQESKENGHPDAWALHGWMYEIGYCNNKDEKMAALCYLMACDKGSLWGKIKYASTLIDGVLQLQDYAKAQQLLTSVEDEPDFLKYGGGYYLGQLYEHGWGANVDLKKALKLYADSFMKCPSDTLKKQSYEASKRVEKTILIQEIDHELANVEMKDISVEELTSIARRYEMINDEDDARYYWRLAAEKGDSYSACRLGVMYYVESKRKDQTLLEQSFKLFEKGAEGNYAPCKYNVAVMYLYGYGVSPNHELALDYYNKYMEQIKDEVYDDYENDDFIPLLSGARHHNNSGRHSVPSKVAIDLFNDPSELYDYAFCREQDSRLEIPIYFYSRALQKGHPKAAGRLEALRKQWQ